MLTGHETYLRRLEAATQQLVIFVNHTNCTKQSPHSSYSPRCFDKKQWAIPPIKTHENRWVSQGQSPTYSPDNCWASYGSNQPNRINHRYQPRFQICDHLGHTAKTCSKFNSNTATINCTQTSNAMDKPWLLDSGASHTITSDLANLTTHSEYDGTDEVTLGDGSGLEISHTGSLSLNFPKNFFHFPDTLCVRAKI